MKETWNLQKMVISQVRYFTSFPQLFSISSGRSKQFKNLRANCISPTLPGWANSSPTTAIRETHQSKCERIMVLIHILNDLRAYKIYILVAHKGQFLQR